MDMVVQKRGGREATWGFCWARLEPYKYVIGPVADAKERNFGVAT